MAEAAGVVVAAAKAAIREERGVRRRAIGPSPPSTAIGCRNRGCVVVVLSLLALASRPGSRPARKNRKRMVATLLAVLVEGQAKLRRARM